MVGANGFEPTQELESQGDDLPSLRTQGDETRVAEGPIRKYDSQNCKHLTICLVGL
jgi:hypothetical protein